MREFKMYYASDSIGLNKFRVNIYYTLALFKNQPPINIK
jgi:hypothetical protein